MPGRRFRAIPPALSAGVGFILSMMCLFAGSSPGYREDMDMLTLNTSMIGINVLHSSPSSGSGGGLLGSLGSKLSDAGKNLSSEIQADINSGVEDIAQHLNISDFYSWHVLDYCTGYFEPSPVINATNQDPAKNVTGCSAKTAFYQFNMTDFLQQTLNSDISIASLVPQDVEDALDAAMTAARAMFVLYTLSAGLAGLAMFTGWLSIVSQKQLYVSINATLAMIVFLTLGLASSISTGVINKVVDSVNSVGTDVGISATKGYKFVLMTWMATLVMFVAWLGWMLVFCLAKRRNAKSVAEKEAMENSKPYASDPIYMHT